MVESKPWSPELEGLRGLASLWVLLGHICLLVQCKIPLLYDPGWASICLFCCQVI